MATYLETHASEVPVPASNPLHSVSVLLIGSNDIDWARLSEIFEHTVWKLYRAKDFPEAVENLRRAQIPVLVTESNLKHGRTWRDVLELASATGKPRVIVASSSQDDPLWAQVINLGAYDVLMKPFERAEVVRVISLAWLNWRDEVTARRGNRRPAATA